MDPEFQEKLKSCPNLPSPPTIAIKIIELANDPEADFKKISQLLNCDPALASKILRIANSPLYPYGKKVENLQQAMMVIGLNATISLALTFSLINSLQTAKGTGLDYALYWKRALMAGTACQVLGNTCGVEEKEELYLAGLLQDLGMLALDQVFPDFYGAYEGQQSDHASVIAYEQQSLSLTHGTVGSWLLTQWALPDRLRLAIAGSDDPSRIPAQDERARFTYCVALSGMIAEIFLRETDEEYLHMMNEQASSLLQLTPETLIETLETIRECFADTERVFETDLQPWDNPQRILEHARESLLVRNLHVLKEVDELKKNNADMEVQFHNLEESHRHDPLTGTLTRAYLDTYLQTSFEQAIANEECLTLIFGDLDKFKSVNDTYGHQAGDAVLQSSAQLLLQKIRGTDRVGRYGGEEFVLILPKAQHEAATMVCERIMKAFRETSHKVSAENDITVTISLGIATHTPESPYPHIADLLHDADEAVYYSKTHGGNQYTHHYAMKAKQPV
jgi:diguanylate cyclase (GGDEF)-like protein